MFTNAFSFDGRIRRSEYGITFIIFCIATALINVIVEESRGDAGFLYLGYVPAYWFFWAQGAKRCHDLGKSGWFQIIPFYPIWMIFQDGIPGSNEYGNNPKEPNNSHYSDFQHGPKGGSGTTGYTGYQGGHNGPNEGNGMSYSGNEGGHRKDINQDKRTGRNDGSYNGNLYN
jgi:uncharacterized membrane protein YhaH (DUF805 family)